MRMAIWLKSPSTSKTKPTALNRYGRAGGRRPVLVSNVPFLAYGYNEQDVVKAADVDGQVNVIGVAERSGHSTYRLFFPEATDNETLRKGHSARSGEGGNRSGTKGRKTTRAAKDWGKLIPEMKQLRRDGLSKRAIATQLGVSRTSVIRLLRARSAPKA